MGNSVVIGLLWTIWNSPPLVPRACEPEPDVSLREVVVDQAPFDVLGAAEMRFDPPAELREPHDLRIRQRRPVLQLRVDRLFPRPARR